MTLILLLLLLLPAVGCVSQKKAQAEARQAYFAGQEQQRRQMDPQHPVVFVQGPVQNPVVPWEEGLSLTRAIASAVYTAFMNPLVVRVLRNGQIVGDFKGIDLLHHQDMPLEPGDTVFIIP